MGGEVHFNRLHKSISVDGHTRHWSCQFGTANWAPAISRLFLGTNTGLDLEKLRPGEIGKEGGDEEHLSDFIIFLGK